MVLSEFLAELQRRGVDTSETQIRWAIRTNRVARPRIDGAHRFDFSDANVAEIAAYFTQRHDRQSLSLTGEAV